MLPPSIRRFAGSPGGRNLTWLLTEKFVRFALNVVVGFWVARYLGPSSFGRLNAAFSTIALGLAVAECGLDAVVRRELLADPERARAWLRTAWRLRLVAGSLCYVVVLGASPWLAPSAVEWWLLAVVSFQLFQPALGVGDIWLQANLQAGAAFRAQWLVLVLGAAARLTAVALQAPVVVFAAIFVAESLGASAVVTGRAYGRIPADTSTRPPPDWRRLLATALPLVVSGVAVVIYMRIDLVMLPRLAGDHEAGLFAAAVRISELGYFLPGALASSTLPAILAAREAGAARHADFLQRYFDLSMIAACAFALPVTVGAPWIIHLAYGGEFAGAAPVLALHVWATVFVFLGTARTQFLLNEQLTRFVLVATSIGAVLNVGLNLLFIPRYGAFGAAGATVVSQATAAWLTSFLHPAARGVGRHQAASLLLPAALWRIWRRR